MLSLAGWNQKGDRKMTIRFRDFTLLCILFLCGCNYFDGIPMIGIDANGNPAQAFAPESEYSKRLIAVASSVQDSTLPVLNQLEGHSAWILRNISIGIGVNAEIGIGPFKIGAFPRFRMVFTNSSEPSLP